MNTYFDIKLTYNEIKFQLTDKSTPDEREIHTYHEILYFIEGQAELLTEEKAQELKSRSLIIIPRGTYHFIRLHSPSFLRLKISIPQTAEESIPTGVIKENLRIINYFTEDIDFVLKKLVSILHDERAKPFYVYGAFLMLVAELDKGAQLQSGKDTARDDIVSSIISRISDNPGGDLSVAALAKAVNASPSAVTHGFKKHLGISLHSYIKQKRLIHARELILSGNKPSKIFADCGYREYSSFYRAYTDFFGYPPSKENK